ncbi:hypothetical protein [Sphingomonas sp.]|uniref:hypothetical protein n=1 Tax=Sphingomonas sp. TaxID=28214 RepID=UPI003B004F89
MVGGLRHAAARSEAAAAGKRSDAVGHCRRQGREGPHRPAGHRTTAPPQSPELRRTTCGALLSPCDAMETWIVQVRPPAVALLMLVRANAPKMACNMMIRHGSQSHGRGRDTDEANGLRAKRSSG